MNIQLIFPKIKVLPAQFEALQRGPPKLAHSSQAALAHLIYHCLNCWNSVCTGSRSSPPQGLTWWPVLNSVNKPSLEW